MKRFVAGIAREQATLFAEYLEDWVDEDNLFGSSMLLLKDSIY